MVVLGAGCWCWCPVPGAQRVPRLLLLLLLLLAAVMAAAVVVLVSLHTQLGSPSPAFSSLSGRHSSPRLSYDSTYTLVFT